MMGESLRFTVTGSLIEDNVMMVSGPDYDEDEEDDDDYNDNDNDDEHGHDGVVPGAGR
jgi:hypothetical protein